MSLLSDGFRWGRALALGALAAGLARAVAPADPGAPALSLADARRLALERNADFRTAEAQVDAAWAQLKIAREYPNPTLGLSTAKISTDGTPEGTGWGNSLWNRSYDSIAALSQLFVIAKRGPAADAATAGAHAAEFQRDDARRLLLQAVTSSYAAAVAANEQADALLDSAKRLRREADIAAHRFQVGDISASDQAQLEILADQDELGAETQRLAAHTAVLTLETLIGEPAPHGATRLTGSLAELTAAITPGLADAPILTRPDIAAAEAAVKQADAQVKLQRRQRVPDVTASVQFERNPIGQPDTVGFGLSLPLPFWNHYNGEVGAARAARTQAEAQLDKTRIAATANVESARLSFLEAYARAQRYRNSLAPKSAAVTKSVSYSYEKGGASLVLLLEAERDDNQIRVGSVQAQADAASAAVALQAALGRLETSPPP